MSVAGDGDASVPMEPEGVTMASSISAAIREPGVTVSHLRLMSREVSVFLLLVMVMHPYRWSLKVTMASDLSAAVYVDSQVSTTYQQPSVWIVRYL